MKYTCTLLATLFFFTVIVNAQQERTVGLIKSDSLAFEGYTLLAPMYGKNTYLIDMCGTVVHEWTSDYFPGHTTRLLPNGNLLRMVDTRKTTIGAAGGGGIEIRSWDGELVWFWEYGGDTASTHHGIWVMPNGNFLVNCYHVIPGEDVIAAGRDTSMVSDVMWSDKIIEVRPTGLHTAEVVWEWRAFDHLIQGLDSTKPNYGLPRDNPGRIAANYPQRTGPLRKSRDWFHFNSVAYNAELDQIVVSVLYFDELWVIDHSTTSQEAATSSGGRSGRGGDILYRWGNPAAYGRGTSNDRKFFGQHDPQWIPEGYEEAGRMLVFNNGNQRFGSQYSSIETYDLPLLPDGTYRLEQNKPYEPADYSWIYKQTDGPLFFSPIISGAERLANGNTFICEGTKGRLFEVDRDGVVRWEYVNPIMRDSVVPQGTVPTNNLVFKAYRYGKDYPAFAGKELRSRGLLERNPTLYPCVWGTVSSVHTDGENASEVPNLYPNPFYDILTVSHPDLSGTVMLVDALGRVVLRATAQNNRVDFHTSLIPNGLYHITTERGSIGTAVKAF